MKLKLKHSIYIMIVFCSVVPVFIWTLFSAYDSQNKIKTIIQENITAIGGSQVLSIENFCEGRKESMETISRMQVVKDALLSDDIDASAEAINRFLVTNEKHKSYIASISVVNAQFQVIGSSENYELGSISELKYIGDQFKTGQFIMGNVYERETDKGTKRLFPLYIGVYDDNQLIGYLIEEINCEYFDRLRLQTDFLEDGTLYLMDGEGELITAGTANSTDNREEYITTPEEREDYNRAWNEIDHDKVTEGTIFYEIRGQEYMTYFSKMQYADWTLRITENMSAQWASNQNMMYALIFEGVVLACILMVVQIILTKKLVGPFNQIVQTMKDVQEKKDYSIRAGVTGNDEVAVVARGIDELLDFIEKEELEEKRRHREFQEKAKHKEFLSEAMLQNMPSGYHRCLPDAENGFPFIQLGSHVEEILGWTPEEIKNELGNCYLNLIWPEDRDVAKTYTEMIAKVGSGNAYDTSIYRMKHKDGGYRWITDATMFVDLGEESFFQGVIADITPYIEEMEAAKQQAEASNQAKTNFLSQMSHDIRTPMNAIIGFTNLAKDAASLEEIHKEYIPKIEIASNHLLMIINDVLEMNSIEKGKITFHREPRDLKILAHDILAVMQLQTQEKGLTFLADVDVKDTWIYCDENRFNRVMMNLMSNAVKFTSKGGTVSFIAKQKESKKAGYATYSFEISDTGIGMSPDFIPLVFDPFERERTSTVSRVQGTGLGMAIVKSIVESAGGRISVESELGKGTSFTVEMDFALVEPEVRKEVELGMEKEDQKELSPEQLKEYFQGERILLVEDNEFNRSIAEVILENAGFIVETAEDGHIAVDMVAKAPSEDYYKFILMDIQMPTMDGYEATKNIRGMSGARAKTKIIAVTANAFESDRQLAKEAGMDEHLPKPIDVAQLYATLKKLI